MALAAAKRLEDEVQRLVVPRRGARGRPRGAEEPDRGGRGVRRGRQGVGPVARHPVAARPRGPEMVNDEGELERLRKEAAELRALVARAVGGRQRAAVATLPLPAALALARGGDAGADAPVPARALERDDRDDALRRRARDGAPVEAPPGPGGRVTPRRAAIVVLCWNRWDLTRRCLETLKAHTDLAEADVIAVDNGSTDETPARLAELPWVRVVTNASNLGYVRGNNAGIAAAPPDADVVLLNNDVEIHQDGWLDALRETAHASADVGIVGCRLVLPDGRLLHAGTFILPDTFWGQQIGALETDVNQYAATRDVEGIVFACAYVKREVLAEDRRALREVPLVLRGHGLLPAREGRGVPHGGVRRRHARPPRARLDRGPAEDVRGRFPGEPEDVSRPLGKEARGALPARAQLAVDPEFPDRLRDELPRDPPGLRDERESAPPTSTSTAPARPSRSREDENARDYVLNVIAAARGADGGRASPSSTARATSSTATRAATGSATRCSRWTASPRSGCGRRTRWTRSGCRPGSTATASSPRA